jgi:UDP-N-acetylglucosamine diphosphorylase/glucosamine-1-phosphate N-acetyltransferase
MKDILLFEDEGFIQLLPLVFWRTVFELRVGRKIILDRAAEQLGRPIQGVWARDWMAKVAEHRCGAPANRPVEAGAILINGRWLMEHPVEFPKGPAVGLADDQLAYIVCDERLARRLTPVDLLDPQRRSTALAEVPRTRLAGEFLRYPWDLVRKVRKALQHEWHDADAAIEVPLDGRVTLMGEGGIHVGERCEVHPTAVLDATEGPVYLSHDVRVGAYAVLEGPLYVGPGSSIRPHAWLHGANSIGPICKIAGEVDGCVINGYTNKQHHGFLGHSVVGSWVNLGAGTVNSDLKNTYGSVRVPLNGTEVDTGETFFGAVIGDHAKTGINSSIPTGAVIGFAACTAGSRLLPKYVPSFGWVTDQGLALGKPDRLLDVASKVMARRNIDLTDDEVELFLDLGTRVQEYEVDARRVTYPAAPEL